MRAGTALSFFVAGGLLAACSSKPLSPEEARAKGDALLKQMSQSVATTPVFSYTVEETRERVQPGGAKTEDRFTRRITVRRPNALTFSDGGTGHDLSAWYDGSHLTLLSNEAKVWARGPMPATLDEALDFESSEYALQLPTADLLYTSPYDALMTPDTTGGWAGTESIGGTTYDRLSYSQPMVDWQVWLAQDERKLPHQAQITYKQDEGQPVTRVVFKDWNPAPQVSDATFKTAIPDGYRRIKLMRYATIEAPAPDAPPSAKAPK